MRRTEGHSTWQRNDISSARYQRLLFMFGVLVLLSFGLVTAAPAHDQFRGDIGTADVSDTKHNHYIEHNNHILNELADQPWDAFGVGNGAQVEPSYEPGFSASGLIPGPTPTPAPTPTGCGGADVDDPNPPHTQRKCVLFKQLQVVEDIIRQRNYHAAANKLEFAIQPKLDGFFGGRSQDDWITEEQAQIDLFPRVKHLVMDLRGIQDPPIPQQDLRVIDIGPGLFANTSRISLDWDPSNADNFGYFLLLRNGQRVLITVPVLLPLATGVALFLLGLCLWQRPRLRTSVLVCAMACLIWGGIASQNSQAVTGDSDTVFRTTHQTFFDDPAVHHQKFARADYSLYTCSWSQAPSECRSVNTPSEEWTRPPIVTGVEIREPSSGQTIDSACATLYGDMAFDMTVTVDGEEVFADEFGRFSRRVKLQPGSNSVAVIGQAFGNSFSPGYTVTY